MNTSAASSQPVALHAASAVLDAGQSDEDLARADTYGLLAELFAFAPSDQLLHRLAASGSTFEELQTPLTRAWQDLVAQTRRQSPTQIRAEYDALFVAVGKPEVVATASFYRSGTLNQQALVDVRRALAELGIEFAAGSGETEDHFAVVCEVMRYLVAGEVDANDAPQDMLAAQQRFFVAHLANWAFDLFDAIEQHRQAGFYRAVAGFARAFLEVEQQAFDLYRALQV